MTDNTENFDQERAELQSHYPYAEEKVITESLCKLHGLFAPEHATQININLDRAVEQLEKLPDAELLRIAGTDNQYLMPKKDGNKED